MRRTTVVGLAAGFGLCLLVSVSLAQESSGITYVEQGWSEADRQLFYTTPQGSQLVPYSWFLALEAPGSPERFVSDGLARFGYLANSQSATNPDGLPIGFVRDASPEARDQVWLGLTCAACHTSQIRYGGKTLRIDGGPADADVFAFLSQLGAALTATDADPERFQRFAARVLGGKASDDAEARLRADLKAFARDYAAFIRDSTTEHAWGPARADAFGMIFNRVSSIGLKIAANNRPPNAPVSYPFLWGTHRHDRVQWSGSAENELVVKRLARNVGQALGVFGKIELRPPTPETPFYRSTVNRVNLLRLEQWISDLCSPRWPEAILGRIDAARAARGERIYRRNCAGCHPVVNRDDDGLLKVTMDPLASIKTDPAMVTNVVERRAETGVLKGVKEQILAGSPLGPVEPVGKLVRHAAVGAILAPISGGDWKQILQLVPAAEIAQIRAAMAAAAGGAGAPPGNRAADQARLSGELARAAETVAKPDPRGYKARSLDGIWATAPYLHNGSVASLYELLLPEEQRKVTFTVGSREFDPVNVGFKSDPFPGGFLFDTRVNGNRNIGHTGPRYGTQLADEERRDLVEYMKRL